MWNFIPKKFKRMDYSTRIQEFREVNKTTMTRIARALDMDLSQYSKVEKGKLGFTSVQLMELCSTFKINLNWLLAGTGRMLLQESMKDDSHLISEPATSYKLRTDHDIESQKIPLYNKEASASLVSLFTNLSTEMQIGTISIPNIPKCDGAIYITGDSMYPLLKSGDMVMFKKVPDPQSAIFFFGEMYLLAFTANDDDYIAVKWLQRSERDGFVKLVSENQHHQPMDIPISSITALAIIKASVRINSMK